MSAGSSRHPVRSRRARSRGEASSAPAINDSCPRALLPESSKSASIRIELHDLEGLQRGSVRVDPDSGLFQIGPLPPHTYRVRIRGDALPRTDLGTHILLEDQELDLGVVNLVAEVPLQVQVHRSDGRQVTWLRSLLSDTQGGEWSAGFSGGLFDVEPLPPGNYELSVYSPVLQSRNVSLELVPGRPVELDVVLNPGIETRFRIQVPEGREPARRVQVTVQDLAGHQVAKIRPLAWNLLETGESLALGPGAYRVEAIAGDLRGRADFTVPDRADGIVAVIVEMR